MRYRSDQFTKPKQFKEFSLVVVFNNIILLIQMQKCPNHTKITVQQLLYYYLLDEKSKRMMMIEHTEHFQ